jgi:hypothetical protein
MFACTCTYSEIMNHGYCLKTIDTFKISKNEVFIGTREGSSYSLFYHSLH